MTAAAERYRDRLRVDRLTPAAHDTEDAVLHLDEEQERAAVGEIDELVGEVRDPVDVLRPRHGRHEHLVARRLHRLERIRERVQQLALGRGERQVQVVREQVLPCAVA